MLLERVQTQLQHIYGIEIPHRVADYLIDRKEALHILSTEPGVEIPKELFLVRRPEEDTVEVALFLDSELIRNLETNNPFVSLNDKNLSDFCIMIEGISHFVYFLFKADQNHEITQLEMELQAEIDKFLMLFFYLRDDEEANKCRELFEILFENFHLIEQLSQQAKERYLTASTLASRYCYHLQQKYRSPKQIRELLDEIRKFYKLSQEQKIHHINY